MPPSEIPEAEMLGRRFLSLGPEAMSDRQRQAWLCELKALALALKRKKELRFARKLAALMSIARGGEECL